jgi:hypothetical protein
MPHPLEETSAREGVTMREQPIIYRPNSFTQEEWDALSRDEQIRWWGGRKPKDAAPPNPLRAVERYRQGIVTKVEFYRLVFERLTEGNVREFVEKCPADLRLLLSQDAANYPPDDDDERWGQCRRIQAVCFRPWDTPTKEEFEAAGRETIRLIRQGVRLFRANTHSSRD